MARLRAGLIGLGMMGRHHARVLSSLEDVDLVAVADPAGDQYQVANGRKIVSAVDELINEGIDYCTVAVPTAFHEEAASALAAAGVHTLVEKPLSHSADSAARIADMFEDAGLIGAVGHIERFNAAIQQARKRVEEGELGDIFQISTRRQGPFPGRIADVGVIKDLGTHDIDLTAWIAQQQFESVSARTTFKSGREHEDLVAILGKLDMGTVTSHLVNWLSPLKERVTTITGENGMLVADTLSSDLTFYSNGKVKTTWDDISRFRGVSEGDVIRYSFHKPEPLRVEHEAFRDAIMGRSTNIVTMQEGLQTLLVAEACIESAGSGAIPVSVATT